MNVDFKSLPFEERIKQKDNTSVEAFNKYCTQNKIKFTKFGIDGSEMTRPKDIEPLLRAAPDKYCELPSGDTLLFEIKGCGNKGVYVKCIKIDQYLEWNKLKNLIVFIYNSVTKQYSIIPIQQLHKICKIVGKSINENMGEIYHIPCNLLEWSDLPITHKQQYADNYNK